MARGGRGASRHRVVTAVAAALALVMTACGGGSEVPDGWSQTADEDLIYAAVVTDEHVYDLRFARIGGGTWSYHRR